jgi:hypothetical protein
VVVLLCCVPELGGVAEVGGVSRKQNIAGPNRIQKMGGQAGRGPDRANAPHGSGSKEDRTQTADHHVTIRTAGASGLPFCQTSSLSAACIQLARRPTKLSVSLSLAAASDPAELPGSTGTAGATWKTGVGKCASFTRAPSHVGSNKVRPKSWKLRFCFHQLSIHRSHLALRHTVSLASLS